MSAKRFLQTHWPSIAIAATAAAIGCVTFAMVWTLPPRSIVMATGAEGGDYYELGKRYRAVLAQDGVDVQLVPTAGSADNLKMLRDPASPVSVALMQGGVIGAATASGLESLGTVFYEPYWWFRRSEIKETGIAGLRGRRISVGPEGSGTRALSLPLLARAGIDAENSELLPLLPRATAEKLETGEIDIAFMVASWQSPVVQELLADDRVVLTGYARADALVALYPFLTRLTLPRGAADLAKDRPPADVTLIASKASLVIRGDLHPAIQYLLLNAATEIHGNASVFRRANQFPAAEGVELPLSSEALRFYKSGLPFLHEYFTFWMAELIGRLVIVLIPVFGVLLPMVHFLPRIYNWAMRSRILRMYGELRLLEDATAREPASDKRDMQELLDHLEEQVNHLKVPVAYANLLYELRMHIGLVREGLRKRSGASLAPAAAEEGARRFTRETSR
jgi:TRAP transporter TAXI family solute receptor